jgi:CheY-like chemotaxis protein/anti-sigma regulatory factor (Ser/Thr protein kinase)
MELETQPFEVQEAVEGALDLLAPQAASKGLELGYWIEEGVPPMIVGDVTRLRQILVNLVANAVKFTHAGEVWVTISQRTRESGEAELCFAVSDSGIGIRQEQIPQLFTAFSQLDNSTTRRYGGTGLGLAISRRLAELMDGTMWVESELGVGSTFFFTVLVQEAVAAASPAATGATVQLLKDRRLLIVARPGHGRTALEGYAARWQMQWHAVGDAQAARAAILGPHSYDVMMVDMGLPDEDGLSLANSVMQQRIWQEKPILLLVARNYVNIRQQAEEVGVRVPLYKPLKPSDLLAALALSLGGKASNGAIAAARANAFDSNLGRAHPLDILLAEDNVVNQKVALLLLDRLGYRADVAASGQEVIEAVERQHYDVILMDVHMPEMDGIEATRNVFAMLPPAEYPYIIAMTAAAMQEDRERCRQVGMHNFISKPVKVEELVRALLQAQAWLASQIRV